MPEVESEKLHKVVREYLQRQESLFLTRNGASTDDQIDCPLCDGYRTLEYRWGRWKCLKVSCEFTFSDNFIPPSPEEFREYLETRKRMERTMAIDFMVHELGLETF